MTLISHTQSRSQEVRKSPRSLFAPEHKTNPSKTAAEPTTSPRQPSNGTLLSPTSVQGLDLHVGICSSTDRLCFCCHDSYLTSRPAVPRLHRKPPPLAYYSISRRDGQTNLISLLSRDLFVGTSRYKDQASVVGVALWGIGSLEKQK